VHRSRGRSGEGGFRSRSSSGAPDGLEPRCEAARHNQKRAYRCFGLREGPPAPEITLGPPEASLYSVWLGPDADHLDASLRREEGGRCDLGATDDERWRPDARRRPRGNRHRLVAGALLCRGPAPGAHQKGARELVLARNTGARRLPSTRHQSQKVAAFVDLLQREFSPATATAAKWLRGSG